MPGRVPIQAEAGPLTVEAVEQVIARAAVPIMRLLEDKPQALALAMPLLSGEALWPHERPVKVSVWASPSNPPVASDAGPIAPLRLL